VICITGRSIFQRFTQVIDYFDARMIGLTATPANFIDRDTFRIFDCANQTPTFLYTFKQAVNEKHLVNFSLYKAQTGFQRKGIKGVDLTEEDRNALIDQGIDPDTIDYEGTDIEIDVSNKDTLRKQWEEKVGNYKKATPEKRKEMLSGEDENARPFIKQGLERMGVKFPD